MLSFSLHPLHTNKPKAHYAYKKPKPILPDGLRYSEIHNPKITFKIQ